MPFRNLVRDIKSGSLKDLDEVASALESIHTSYREFSWDWTTKLLSDQYDIDVRNIAPEQCVEIVTNWESSSIKLDKMILSDARKEFDNTSKIGFGIDGDEETADLDFTAVRGNPQDNKFTAGLEKEMEQIAEKSGKLRDMLGRI